MNKLITVIIMSLLTQGAAGCGSQTAIKETTEPAANIEEKGDKKEEVSLEAEQIANDSDFIDSVEYTVETTDHSIVDNDAAFLYLYYDAVQIKDDIPNKDDINAAIVQYCENVFERNGGIESLLENAKSPLCTIESPFECTVSSEVTNNSEGIFSIIMTTNWYMGGVFDYGYGCFTYDLNEGKAVEISSLLNMSEEAAAELMKEKMMEFMDARPDGGWYYDVIEDYGYNDFKWFIDEGQLMLALDKYEAATGATGGAIIETGIYIK